MKRKQVSNNKSLLVVAALYIWLVVEALKMLSEEDIGNDPE